MIGHKIFDHAATWVHERSVPSIGEAVPVSEIREAFEALAMAARDATSTFLIPDLFPGVNLDVLYVYGAEEVGPATATQNSAPDIAPGLSAQALTAIGSALSTEMQSTGTDMVRYQAPNAEIIVSRPSVRPIVLQATGTTLLTKQ